jgi:hypothetical protein
MESTGGMLVSLCYYLRKDEGEHQVTFDIHYRPNSLIGKTYRLSITLPDPQERDADEQPLYGA